MSLPTVLLSIVLGGVGALWLLVSGATWFATGVGLDAVRAAAAPPGGAVPVVVGLCIYAAAHLARALRLAYLAQGEGTRSRDLLALHFFSAAVSALVPFKLGEPVRVALLAAHCKRGVRGLHLYWCERFFDAVVLFVFLVVALLFWQGPPVLLTPIAAWLVVFGVGTLIAGRVIPAELPRLAVAVASRRQGRVAIRALELLAVVRGWYGALHIGWRQRVSTIVALLAVIWIAELAALAVLVPSLGGDIVRLCVSLLAVLTSITAGAVLGGRDSFVDQLLASGAWEHAVLGETRRYLSAITLLLLVAGLSSLLLGARPLLGAWVQEYAKWRANRRRIKREALV